MICNKVILKLGFLNRGLRLPVFLSTYNMSKKVKKLTLQYAYLQVALEELKEICVNVEKEMREYMEKHHPQSYAAFYDAPQNIEPPEKPENPDPIMNEEEIEENEETEEDINNEEKAQTSHEPKNRDLKKLYRKIAEKTHPDKTGSNDHAEQFSEAAKAYSENDIATLLNLAGRFNIELLELSEESIVLLESNIKNLAMEIHQRKQTSAWAWSQCQSDEERESIIQQILTFKGVNS